MRDVESAAKAGDPRAKLAQDMYFYRIKKYIGAYAAAMGGLDVVVFTAGVGENQIGMRSEVCKNMEFLGIKFDILFNFTLQRYGDLREKTKGNPEMSSGISLNVRGK